jgi:hypothetical protein
MHAEQTLYKTKNVKPPVFDFGDHWKNELRSIMDVTVKADGTITGEYKSAVSGAGGPTPSEKRPWLVRIVSLGRKKECHMMRAAIAKRLAWFICGRFSRRVLGGG